MIQITAKNMFSFSICLLSLTMMAQDNFEENIIIGTLTTVLNPVSIFTADIDGDGDKDVLSASYDDHKIAWYENLDGIGNFSTQKVIGNEEFQASSVFAADLDNDGDMDVLSAASEEGTISWYENLDGDGTFGVKINITTNDTGASSVYAADIDGDGDMDVQSASLFDDTVAWYENLDGQGNFSTPKIISDDANGAASVVAVDVDGDADLDVVASSINDQTIAWYENLDGQGNFGSLNTISTNANGVYSIHAADFDDDGAIDILMASLGADTVSWFRNLDGEGNYGPAQIISANAILARSVNSLDVDNDGDLDVVSVSQIDNKLAWYENLNGQGNFSTEQIISTTVNEATFVFVEDIDNDGFTDILSASSGTDQKIAWHKNDGGQGVFEIAKPVIANAHGASSVYAADLDDDGDMDVLSASLYDNKISWYENLDGAGTYGAQKIIASNTISALSVYAVDIDNDNRIDVLSASEDDKIAWYRNLDGLGHFGPQQIISLNADGPQAAYAADIDGDGDMDVYSASAFDRKIAWFENIDGQGNFGPLRVVHNQGGFARDVTAADIDNDGDIDLISAKAGNEDSIIWYENLDGQGNFGTPNIINSDINDPISVQVKDVDNDGDMDVISASYNDNKIAWYENIDGDGNFGVEQTVDNDATRAWEVFLLDMDADGDQDILAAIFGDNQVVWYENLDGQGNFSNRIIIDDSANAARSVFASDIDNDGDLDILATASDLNNSKISWYENTSLLSVNEVSLSAEPFYLYPNPSENILTIESVSIIDDIRLYDLNGRILDLIVPSEAVFKYTIETMLLDSGIYLIELNSNNTSSAQKFIKK